MDIVEHEHERLGGREALEQLPHGAMRAVALVLERSLARFGELGQRRQHPSELGAHIVVERLQAARIEPRHVLVEGVHEHPEGQIRFELGRAARQHDLPQRVGPLRQLGEHAGLADSGLPEEHDRGRLGALEPGHGALDRTDFLGAPDELLGDRGHASS